MSYEEAANHLRLARYYYAKHEKYSNAYTAEVKKRAAALLYKDPTGQLTQGTAELLAAKEPKAKEYVGNEQMYSRWASLEAQMGMLEAMEEQWTRSRSTPSSTPTDSS